jgi:hypothetical protein
MLIIFCISQPCLAACIDQTHKFLVTQASFPNEDSFNGDTNFCLVTKKLIRSCKGDRRPVLDIKYPNLCPVIQEATKDFDFSVVKCEFISASVEVPNQH